MIGCRILTQPFFLERDDWIPVPSWARQIVHGKTYSTEAADGRALWEQVATRLQSSPFVPEMERFAPLRWFGRASARVPSACW